MTEGDPILSGAASEARPRTGQVPVREPWIWIGLALAFAGRIFSASRPGRTGDLFVLALFLLPLVILAYSAYKLDAGGRSLLRVLRATLFAFLVIEAFYFGVSIGGLAAAAGAFVIFTRFIRPRMPTAPL